MPITFVIKKEDLSKIATEKYTMTFSIHVVKENVPFLISLKELMDQKVIISFLNLRLLTTEGNVMQLEKVPSGHLSFPIFELDNQQVFVTQLGKQDDITIEKITKLNVQLGHASKGVLQRIFKHSKYNVTNENIEKGIKSCGCTQQT